MPLPHGYKLLHTTELLTEPPLVARTYQVPHRTTGRRVVVEDRAGTVQFDTDDCYDIANACDKVDCWATARIRAGRLKPQEDLVQAGK